LMTGFTGKFDGIGDRTERRGQSFEKAAPRFGRRNASGRAVQQP